jgi:hypothetical protein
MLLLVKPPVGREMLRRQGIAPAVGRDCSGVGGVGERKEVRQTDQLIFFFNLLVVSSIERCLGQKWMNQTTVLHQKSYVLF